MDLLKLLVFLWGVYIWARVVIYQTGFECKCPGKFDIPYLVTLYSESL